MNVIVVEKSTGTVMSCSKPATKAIAEARKRRCALDDMVFVTGDVDIRIYRLASRYINECFRWLPATYYKSGKDRSYISRAQNHLDLWLKIKKSREVDHPEAYAKPLSVVFGDELSAEIMATFACGDREDCEVFAPFTGNAKDKAEQEGSSLALQYRHHRFILVAHAVLGVYIVGPSTALTSYPGFKFIRVITGKRS